MMKRENLRSKTIIWLSGCRYRFKLKMPSGAICEQLRSIAVFVSLHEFKYEPRPISIKIIF